MQDQDPTVAAPRSVEQAAEHLALALPAEQMPARQPDC
jgi:hypothetical protein